MTRNWRDRRDERDAWLVYLVYLVSLVCLVKPPLRVSNEGLLRPRVAQALPNSLHLSLEEWPRLPFTARVERAPSERARSASKKGTWPHPFPPPGLLVISREWGLSDLLLRASNEGSPRPRVARAQEINSLHSRPS